MTITATQYVLVATTLTATAVATSIGGYTVGASTRSQIIAITLANTATTQQTMFVDVSLYNGSFATPICGRATPIYPGSSFVVVGAEKHVLPTSGAVQVTSYSTGALAVAMTLIEVT